MGEQQRRLSFLSALIRNWKTALGYRLLRSAARSMPGYADAWHCQVAHCARAAGADSVMADMVGEQFTRIAFGVDTRGPDRLPASPFGFNTSR